MISDLVNSLTMYSLKKQNDVNTKWIFISHSVGSLLLNSHLPVSLQELGRLDCILRCLEDEAIIVATNQSFSYSLSIQSSFSDLWLTQIYEVLRLLKSRELINKNPEFKLLFSEVSDVRMVVDKLEIADDRKLAVPIEFNGGIGCTQKVIYDKNDKLTKIISPSLSLNTGTGSKAWEVFNVEQMSAVKVYRRDISDRLLLCLGNNENLNKHP